MLQDPGNWKPISPIARVKGSKKSQQELYKTLKKINETKGVHGDSWKPPQSPLEPFKPPKQLSSLRDSQFWKYLVVVFQQNYTLFGGIKIRDQNLTLGRTSKVIPPLDMLQ